MDSAPRSRCAFTLIELLVVIVIIAVFISMLLPAHTSGTPKAYRTACMYHQKQIAVAILTFNIDHDGHFPWQLSTTNGGSMESISDGSVFPHFRALSEYVDRDARLFFCSSDKGKLPATNLADVLDTNISYFLNIDAPTNNATNSILTGDRNLQANRRPVKSGLFALPTNVAMDWSAKMHRTGGNLAFVDGHAEFVKTNALDAMLQYSAASSNRLCVP